MKSSPSSSLDVAIAQSDRQVSLHDEEQLVLVFVMMLVDQCSVNFDNLSRRLIVPATVHSSSPELPVSLTLLFASSARCVVNQSTTSTVEVIRFVVLRNP